MEREPGLAISSASQRIVEGGMPSKVNMSQTAVFGALSLFNATQLTLMLILSPDPN